MPNIHALQQKRGGLAQISLVRPITTVIRPDSVRGNGITSTSKPQMLCLRQEQLLVTGHKQANEVMSDGFLSCRHVCDSL